MKKESIKLAGILCIITLVAALLLAFVNQVTEPEIRISEQRAAENAVKKILGDVEIENIDENITKGLKGEEVVGYCVTVSPKGFGGEIQMMVGIGTDDKVKGIEILSHGETPGLGAKATTKEFKDRFKDKEPYLNVVKVPTDKPTEVMAITGATITSNAIADGVAQAYDIVKNIEGGSK